MESVWKAAESAGIPVMVGGWAQHMAALDKVAQRYPGLKIAIGHLALPRGKRDEEAFAELDQTLALGAGRTSASR